MQSGQGEVRGPARAQAGRSGGPARAPGSLLGVVAEAAFDPSAYDRFTYTGVDVDLEALTVTGRYRLSGPVGALDLAEIVTLAGGETRRSRPARAAALERVGRLIWLAAGDMN